MMNKLLNAIRTTEAVFIGAHPIVTNVSDYPKSAAKVVNSLRFIVCSSQINSGFNIIYGLFDSLELL